MAGGQAAWVVGIRICGRRERGILKGRIARGTGAEWLLGKVLELTAVGRKAPGAKEWAWHLHRREWCCAAGPDTRLVSYSSAYANTKQVPYGHLQTAIHDPTRSFDSADAPGGDGAVVSWTKA